MLALLGFGVMAGIGGSIGAGIGQQKKNEATQRQLASTDKQIKEMEASLQSLREDEQACRVCFLRKQQQLARNLTTFYSNLDMHHADFQNSLRHIDIAGIVTVGLLTFFLGLKVVQVSAVELLSDFAFNGRYMYGLVATLSIVGLYLTFVSLYFGTRGVCPPQMTFDPNQNRCTSVGEDLWNPDAPLPPLPGVSGSCGAGAC